MNIKTRDKSWLIWPGPPDRPSQWDKGQSGVLGVWSLLLSQPPGSLFPPIRAATHGKQVDDVCKRSYQGEALLRGGCYWRVALLGGGGVLLLTGCICQREVVIEGLHCSKGAVIEGWHCLGGEGCCWGVALLMGGCYWRAALLRGGCYWGVAFLRGGGAFIEGLQSSGGAVIKGLHCSGGRLLLRGCDAQGGGGVIEGLHCSGGGGAVIA